MRCRKHLSFVSSLLQVAGIVCCVQVVLPVPWMVGLRWGERGASVYRAGSFRGIVSVRVVRVLVGASVRALAPPEWSVGDGSEDGASREGFVNGRGTCICQHFRVLRDAVGKWFDRGVVARVYQGGTATHEKVVVAICEAHIRCHDDTSLPTTLGL